MIAPLRREVMPEWRVVQRDTGCRFYSFCGNAPTIYRNGEQTPCTLPASAERVPNLVETVENLAILQRVAFTKPRENQVSSTINQCGSM